ncbi:MAG TPA: hypothetical protein VIH57_22330 [Bacteroidales bacterium]
MKVKIVSLVILSILSFNVSKGFPGKKHVIGASLSGLTVKDNEQKRIKHLNDVANFIAGIPGDTTSEFYQLCQSADWKAYSAEEKNAWDNFKSVSDQATAWRTSELPKAGEPFRTLFYPFGGPDYLFANIFFPNAHDYIMIGLESPGSVPQFDAAARKDMKKVLGLYKDAIADVIQLSFFRTNDMKVELTTKAIDGTTPIIMLFLARSGKQIVDVQPMTLDSEGKLTYCDGKTKHNAVELKFRNPGDTMIRHIYYLSTNLADPALKENKPFYKFLENIDDNSISYIKSATYLMHKTYFSIIRNTVLNKSTMILQDDSGIAYKFFDKDKWDISLYGTYEKPISLFKDFYEPDLFEAFKKSAKPLNYRIGYSKKSALLLAVKKQK